MLLVNEVFIDVSLKDTPVIGSAILHHAETIPPRNEHQLVCHQYLITDKAATCIFNVEAALPALKRYCKC